MKTIIGLISAMSVAALVYAQSDRQEHQWSATLRAVDEAGQPVTAAKIQISYDMTTNVIVGLTDNDGLFKASHRGNSENLGIFAEKSGYYPFRIMYHMGREYDPGKWNPTQTVDLKKIIKPIPMYAKAVRTHVPDLDRPVGYDLMVGDWIAPYGQGIRADFLFRAHFETNNGESDFTLTVSFPNQGDGIQEFSTPSYYLHDQGSELLSSEEAPTNGYQPNWIQTKTRRPGKPMESNWNEYRNFYFRVRTKVDDRGNIVSARYGKIYGDFMQFTYYLNPTPNDRSLEFDPKQNLMTNLEPGEGVGKP